MRRVKIIFHDNCFDGAASAALFSRFYANCVEHEVDFTFAGKAHGAGDVYSASSFDGDVNAVVDFRYSADPRLEWWFDHHVSAFPTADDEAHYKSHPSEHKFFNPSARSCAKFLAETCRASFQWDYSPFAELVKWADIIDGAQFESARSAVALAEPALKLMTWVENNQDPALKLRFIDQLTRKPIAEIAEEPYIKDALEPILARHQRSVDVIRARAAMCDGVVTFDVADDGLDVYNKFIPYFLFPECRYVVGVSLTPSRAKVSVGSNPWSRVKRTVNLAEICERYGGGGHPVVGAVSLPTAELERARTVAVQIAEQLRKASAQEV